MLTVLNFILKIVNYFCEICVKRGFSNIEKVRAGSDQKNLVPYRLRSAGSAPILIILPETDLQRGYGYVSDPYRMHRERN